MVPVSESLLDVHPKKVRSRKERTSRCVFTERLPCECFECASPSSECSLFDRVDDKEEGCAHCAQDDEGREHQVSRELRIRQAHEVAEPCAGSDKLSDDGPYDAEGDAHL